MMTQQYTSAGTEGSFANPTPLMTQWMTGGQMNYMPQAQYLTPQSYGVYRSTPGMAPQQVRSQSPGLWRSGLILSPTFGEHYYNPAVNPLVQRYEASQYWHDTLHTAGAYAGGAALNIGASAILSRISGPVGFAAGMLLPNVGELYEERLANARALQRLSRGKIVSGRYMDSTMGHGFRSVDARALDAKLYRMGIRDSMFEPDDYRQLMSQGIQNELFDYQDSPEKYLQQVKKLRKTITTMMEVTGSTDFRDLVKQFKRMQDLGADTDMFKGIARRENMYSRITGLKHQDLVDTYGAMGSVAFTQQGLSAMQGSQAGMHTAAMVTIGQRNGTISNAYVASAGGKSGLTQRLNAGMADSVKSYQETLLLAAINPDTMTLDENFNLSDYTGDASGLQRLMRRASENSHMVRNDPLKLNLFRFAIPNLRNDMEKREGSIARQTEKMAMMLGRNVLRGRKNVSDEEYLMAGYSSMPGFSPEDAAIMAANHKQMMEQERQEKRRQALADEAEFKKQHNALRALVRNFTASMKEGMDDIIGGFVNAHLKQEAAQSYIDTGAARFDNQLGAGGHNAALRSINGSNMSVPMATGSLLGDQVMRFESDKRGALAITSSKGSHGLGGVGTSFGNWQMNFDVTDIDEKSKKVIGGSFGRWLLSMEKGSTAEQALADKIRRMGSANKAYLESKGLEKHGEFYVPMYRGEDGHLRMDKNSPLYKQWQELSADEQALIKSSQRRFIKTQMYDKAFGRLSSGLQKRVASDSDLQELLWSATVQHGNANNRDGHKGSAAIFNTAYDNLLRKYNGSDANISYDDFIDEAFRVRNAWYGRNAGLRNRFDPTMERSAGQKADSEYWYFKNRQRLNASAGGDIASAIIAGNVDRYKGTVVYKMGAKNFEHPDMSVPCMDCSGWASYIVLDVIDKVNAQSGTEVFDAATRRAFDPLTKSANEQMSFALSHVGGPGNAIQKTDNYDAFAKENMRPGMLIGVTGGSHLGNGNQGNFGHILMTYTDPVTGELMVTESGKYGINLGNGKTRRIDGIDKNTMTYDYWRTNYLRRQLSSGKKAAAALIMGMAGPGITAPGAAGRRIPVTPRELMERSSLMYGTTEGKKAFHAAISEINSAADKGYGAQLLDWGFGKYGLSSMRDFQQVAQLGVDMSSDKNSYGLLSELSQHAWQTSGFKSQDEATKALTDLLINKKDDIRKIVGKGDLTDLSGVSRLLHDAGFKHTDETSQRLLLGAIYKAVEADKDNTYGSETDRKTFVTNLRRLAVEQVGKIVTKINVLGKESNDAMYDAAAQYMSIDKDKEAFGGLLGQDSIAAVSMFQLGYLMKNRNAFIDSKAQEFALLGKNKDDARTMAGAEFSRIVGNMAGSTGLDDAQKAAFVSAVMRTDAGDTDLSGMAARIGKFTNKWGMNADVVKEALRMGMRGKDLKTQRQATEYAKYMLDQYSGENGGVFLPKTARMAFLKGQVAGWYGDLRASGINIDKNGKMLFKSDQERLDYADMFEKRAASGDKRFAAGRRMLAEALRKSGNNNLTVQSLALFSNAGLTAREDLLDPRKGDAAKAMSSTQALWKSVAEAYQNNTGDPSKQTASNTATLVTKADAILTELKGRNSPGLPGLNGGGSKPREQVFESRGTGGDRR